MRLTLKQHSVLPGFGLTLGYTLLYLSLIVLIPLSALFCAFGVDAVGAFWHTVTEPRVLASYRLTFGASLIGAVAQRRASASSWPGAGAVPVSGPPSCSTRWSICRSPCRRPCRASR